MELRDYVRLLTRRWTTILVVLVGCLVGTTVVTVVQVPSYRATAEVLVALPQGGSTATTATSTNLFATVGSFATLAGTPQSVDAAVAAAGIRSTTGVAIQATVLPGTAVLTANVTAPTPQAAQAVANAFATTFPQVLVQLNQISNSTVLTFTTLTPAALPTSTYRPDPLVNTAIGVAVGLLLGLGLAVARESLDRRIRDSRRIEERVGVTVLGVVPNELGDVYLPAVSHPDSARTESYRKVRTNLLFSGPEGMVRSLAITSAVVGEGKSSLAINLAVVCAQAGQRVALVDADLRKPTVHTRLGLSNSAGLTSVLSGEANLDDVVQQERNGVTVLTSGPSPRDPSAMLESPLFRKILTELESTFDIVIVDTTPLLAVSDAAQVCAACEGAVVVSRLRRTTYDSVAKACTTLERVRTPALGIVAVGDDEDPDADYRYYYTADGEATGTHRKDGEPGQRSGWRRPGAS